MGTKTIPGLQSLPSRVATDRNGVYYVQGPFLECHLVSQRVALGATCGHSGEQLTRDITSLASCATKPVISLQVRGL